METKTVTGRVRPTPNLQNIPLRTAESEAIRKAFAKLFQPKGQNANN